MASESIQSEISDGEALQQSLIRNLFNNRWRHIKRSQKNLSASPQTVISKSFSTQFECIMKYAALVPEIYIAWCAPRVDHTDFVNFSPAPNGDALLKPSHVLLCHSLSPIADSAFVLSELGRVLRVSAGLKIPLKLMLADDTWSALNWVVKDFRHQQRLDVNLEFRKSLYNSLGINHDSCSASPYERDGLVSPPINPKEISAQSLDYERLSLALFGSTIASSRITKDILSQKELDRLLSRLFVNDINILGLNVIKNPLQHHIELIKNVVENLKRVDSETFRYFFLQLYYQSNYPGALKIAVSRERDFDIPFRSFCKSIGSDHYSNQAAIYLKDYSVGRDSGGKELTVHPYYFPSGTLYNDPEKSFEHYASCAIMLTDGNKKSKIINILSRMRDIQRARFIADIMSFAHFARISDAEFIIALSNFFLKTKGVGRKSNVEASWKQYTTIDNDRFGEMISRWHDSIWSPPGDDDEMPYYFYPYFWSEMGISIEDESMLVSSILISIQTKYNLIGLN